MLKAAALFYSIIISLIISLIIGGAILLSGLSTNIFQQVMSVQKLSLNAESGLQLLLSDQDIVAENEAKTIDLYKNGNDSVFLSREYWGAYEILVSKSIRKSHNETKIAETGSAIDSTNSYCLYVADLGRPVAVCGNTQLKGTAYLPKAGIQRAYIEGQNYTGSSLVYGQIKQSEKELPAFNKKLIDRISSLRNNAEKNEERISSERLTLKNSFSSPSQTLVAKNPIVIDDTLSGHISIVSSSSVQINSSASLTDIIIYASKVLVKSGFKGSLQIFASDSILIEENVTLNYPSVLGIIRNTRSPVSSCLSLNKNDTVNGSIFTCMEESTDLKHNAFIRIPENAYVFGSVYSDGNVSISGKITGSLMCKSLFLQTNSSVYENHLLNALIDRTTLSPYFTGINLVAETRYKNVVKWLK